MEKIIVLSKFGFKLSNFPEKWISCDKKFISSNKFKKLKVGDLILSIPYNEKNFVKDVTLIRESCQELEGEQPISPSQNTLKASSSSPSPDVKNGLMYGQSVNLAFNHVSNNEMGLNINEAFDLADKIYKEYLKRC